MDRITTSYLVKLTGMAWLVYSIHYVVDTMDRQLCVVLHRSRPSYHVKYRKSKSHLVAGTYFATVLPNCMID